jgi:hypothetical protein
MTGIGKKQFIGADFLPLPLELHSCSFFLLMKIITPDDRLANTLFRNYNS